MRIFRAKDLTVESCLTAEKVTLPMECVVFEFAEQEWQQLSEAEISWLIDEALVLEFVESLKLMKLFFLLANKPGHWKAFKNVQACRINLSAVRFLVAMIRRESRALDGRDAFDFLQFLFVPFSSALQQNGKWQYRSSDRYSVRILPEKWCIGVTAPEEAIRVMIGRRGQTIAEVEQYTDFMKTRISFRD